MKLSNYIALFIIQLFVFAVGRAQKEKIDSLLNILASLHDTARVDCLDELCRLHVITNLRNNPKSSPDSALFYATLAVTEATRLKYYRGIAMALQRKGWIERMFFANYEKAEAFGKEAISWYEKTSNKEGLCYSYVETGHVIFSQSKYEEAIEFLNKSFDCFKMENDPMMIWPLSLTGQVYREKGDYDKAFDIFRRCFQIAKNTNNERRIIQELLNIGYLYSMIENYKTALTYYQQAWSRIRQAERSLFDVTNYAEILSRLHQYDSALYYYNSIDTTAVKIHNPKNFRFYLVSIGEFYLIRKQYDKALQYFLRGLIINKESNDRNQVKRTLLDIAKTCLAMQNNREAQSYAREGLQMALQTRSKQYIADAYQILYSVYDRLQRTDSAYFYYRQYTAVKEEVLSDQTKGKFVAYSYEQKIEVLNKEKEVQQAKLQKQSILKNIFIVGMLVLLLLGFVIFRNITFRRRNEKLRLENELELQKLESEKTKVELKQQATELEMQALRAQMNPHFIFNSLNSINRFILQNNKAQASEYLTKFSKLVRMILQNSQASLITLESELEALELYLDLEVLRFEHHFDYKIVIPKDIETEVLKVPPLIIQPYVENAIWHGLMHKEEKGHLGIEVVQQNNHLAIKITDDGIGRKQAAELASKSATRHKSMGLKITEDRIAMLHRMNGNESPVTINDLVNADGSAAGTEIIIKIPVIYD